MNPIAVMVKHPSNLNLCLQHLVRTPGLHHRHVYFFLNADAYQHENWQVIHKYGQEGKYKRWHAIMQPKLLNSARHTYFIFSYLFSRQETSSINLLSDTCMVTPTCIRDCEDLLRWHKCAQTETVAFSTWPSAPAPHAQPHHIYYTYTPSIQHLITRNCWMSIKDYLRKHLEEKLHLDDALMGCKVRKCVTALKRCWHIDDSEEANEYERMVEFLEA